MVTSSASSESSSRSNRPSARLSPRFQLSLGLAAGGVLTFGSAVFLAGLQPLGLIFAGLGYGIAVLFTLLLFRRGFPHVTLGSGNLVTLARMALIASIAAALGGAANPWAVVAVASIALILDGFDGFLARREGMVSNFGETLDIEVDSAFTVILAASALVAGTIGPVVLLLALPRYVFVTAARFWPWLRGSLPESLARKVICVIQVIALIILQVPGLAGVLAIPIVLLVSSALFWSFARDVVWLWRNRT